MRRPRRAGASLATDHPVVPVVNYASRSINGAESGYVSNSSVLVARTAKQSEADRHATDSSEALVGPGGFWTDQVRPFQSHACGRGAPLLAEPTPTISQLNVGVHEMSFGMPAGPGRRRFHLVPFHRSANAGPPAPAPAATHVVGV